VRPRLSHQRPPDAIRIDLKELAMSPKPNAPAEPVRRLATPSQPIRSVLVLAGLSCVVTAIGSVLAELMAPESDQLLRRLPVVLVLLVMSIAFARRIGWSAIAAGRPSTWRQRGWLAFPALLALVPLAWGWSPDPSTLVALTIGYAATGVYEEIWFRGIMVRAALPLGVGRAAALTALVFGVSHLANILFGQNPAVTAAQAVGAACFGLGYAVIRVRTRAVWFLAAAHFVGDLLLHTTGLHGGALWAVMIGQDTALLVIGLVALRGPSDGASTQPMRHAGRSRAGREQQFAAQQRGTR
jgi:uncharacterized protein